MELRIKEIAKQKNIPIKDIAKALGITASALSQNIAGRASLDRIEDIANVLGVPVRDLFPDEDENSITCPNCGKRFVIEDSHIPQNHKNIRGKEYYK